MNLKLSDGTVMQIPDDATPDAIRNYSARGEAFIKSKPQAASQEAPDPYSGTQTGLRVLSNVVTGIPDAAIMGANLLGRGVDKLTGMITGEDQPSRQLPYLGPMLRKDLNIEELPEDAGYGRRIGEGIAASAPAGIGGAVRATAAAAPGVSKIVAPSLDMLRTTVAPVITSDVGAQAGGAIGGQTGAEIGGILGGLVPGGVGGARNITQSRYAGRGRPDAALIAAAAERAGIRPTSGMLGDTTIQQAERNYANRSGPQGYTSQRRTMAADQMADAAETAAAQRGGTGAGVAAIGEDIAQSATDALNTARGRSQQGQQQLMNRIGPDTEVPVTMIIANAANQFGDLAVPARRALETRITQHLLPLVSKGPDGRPLVDANGNVTVKYGLLQQFRTDLGKSFDMGATPPATKQLYGPTTDAMQEGAMSQNVPRQVFNKVQDFTRGVEGSGGVAERLAPMIEREPQAAYRYLLEGGEQNPNRLQSYAAETARDPRQSRVFGNYLQQIIGDTLGARGARGPINFANRVESMDPGARSILMGPQEGRLRDVATAARAFDYPTSQTGLGRTVGGVTQGLGQVYGAGEIGAAIASSIDPGLASTGRAVALAAPGIIRRINERIMQSQAAQRGLTGAPYVQRPLTINDLIATITAIQQSTQQGSAPYGPNR